MKSRWKTLALCAFPAAAALSATLVFFAPELLFPSRAQPGHIKAGGTERLVIGTFNVENFDLRHLDKPRTPNDYTAGDARLVAQAILSSGADVLALQEIEGEATMRLFVSRFLPGWQFAGSDTAGTQDLYFLWDPRKAAFEEPLLMKAARTLLLKRSPVPIAYFGNESYEFEGQRARRFDRLPLRGDFRTAGGKRFTLINVHLKSQLVIGAPDAEKARRRNGVRRLAQLESLNRLKERFAGEDVPVFILGDYNGDFTKPESAALLSYPLLHLQSGHSYDDLRGNLDYIGIISGARLTVGPAAETETRIERRSTPNKEHPDHDIISVEVNLS
ncbi:MAG: endonuclease/exonuclease/phosphatase family protein [Pyramidobacter sp.]|nr:endonuclease/exonuclease/phosphatase family protein [Pyramidobacter sp.]